MSYEHYTVEWTTKDHKEHSSIFAYEGEHVFRNACDYLFKIKKQDDVISGYVYDHSAQKSFFAFDKTGDL